MSTIDNPALHLPALWGGEAHGWLAALGLVRVLSARWPQIRLHWDAVDGTLVITGGPSTAEEAAGVVLGLTVVKVPTGGVLPGCVPEWPAPGKTPGPAPDSPWGALVTPSGALHPVIRLHAAQTLRGVIDKARGVLAADPDLLLDAITSLGLDERYPAGLWLLRDDREPAPRASAGRDWLALMALPWMPALDTDGSPTAAGWVTPDRLQWRLWTEPVPAAAVAALLAVDGYAPGPMFAAIRRPRSRTNRYRPPYLTPFGMPRNVPVSLVDR